MNQAIAKKEDGSPQTFGSPPINGDFGRNAVARMNMRELKEVAEVFIQSGSFNDVKQAAQAMVKIMAGAELGFSPIVSMTGVHFFNGKVSIGANLIASLIKDGGKYEYKITEHTDTVCTIQFFQRIKDELKSLGVAVSYTWADAQKAQLTGKDNWKKYPKDMLFAAAIRQGARRYCADVLRGITPDTETEIDDAVDRSAMDNAVEVISDKSQVAGDENAVDAEIIEPAPGVIAPESPADIAALRNDVETLITLKIGDDDRANYLGNRDPSAMDAATLTAMRDDLAAM